MFISPSWIIDLILTHDFIPLNNSRLSRLCGPVQAHLKTLESHLGVSITHQNGRFKVNGPKARAEQTLLILQALYEQASKPIEPSFILLMLQQSQHTDTLREGPQALLTKRGDLRPRSPTQGHYMDRIQAHDVSFGVGPAGTGKTYLAVAMAVDALERQSVQRIVLTRPAVEAGEKLGFLPGDLGQKVDPYLRPLYDALYDLMGFERVQKAFERQALEVAPLAFMRGRTLNHSFVILDEAQNTTPEQMKMLLTRLGVGSKAVITGDVSQIDLPKAQASGLVEALSVLKGVEGISFTAFTSADVVRHPLVARIVDAYDAHSNSTPPFKPASKPAPKSFPRKA